MDSLNAVRKPPRPRVAVIGLGGIGSQIALALADRGADVIGFDRLRPPHEAGSSHGESRVIREAYAEGGQYVPLVRRARALWEDLGRRAGVRLLHPTGGVHLGRPDGAYMTSLRAVAAEWQIELTALGAAESAVFSAAPGLEAVYEPSAGWLAIEPAITAALGLARAAGADLRVGTPVLAIDRGPDGCAVRTEDGRVPVDRIVVCAGAWTAELVPELAPSLQLERQTLVWFEPPARPPATIWFGEYAPDHFVYGFPPDRHGCKVAIHHDGPVARLGETAPSVSGAEQGAVAAAANALLASPLGSVRRSRACLYTNTPDRHFAIGALPADERIVVVSACSGHGFKFAPAIGEAAAALALGSEPPVDISPFAPERPAMWGTRARQLTPVPEGSSPPP